MQRRVAKLILIIANMIGLLSLWLIFNYDSVSPDQFLYQMKSSATGVDHSLGISATLWIIVLGLVLSMFEIKIYHHQKYFKKHYLSHALLVLILAICFLGNKLDVLAYASDMLDESSFIKEHYVSADDIVINAPKEKRNLIYIYLESMENTYADTSLKPIKANYIEELSKLAKDNINFSHNDKLGGALSFVGTNWTAASMVAQTSGVNVKVPLFKDYRGQDYMPGVITLGDILEANGYNQVLMMGSDAAFANRDTYFKNHGHYEILDINSLKASGQLDKDYHVWWGFEDYKLFEFAKEEILRLDSLDEPFNFTMLTADTHFPDGYLCPKCDNQYANQYANVIACSSKQVYAFVEWIKAQDFYPQTTIIISGDHLTMDPNFLSDVHLEYTRTIYNCFINSKVPAYKTNNRQFGVFDMFPTSLAALGFEIEGDRLGLGTNLFSKQDSLCEIYGYDYLNAELAKRSEYYDQNFFKD